MRQFPRVFITGGAGYVGSALVPALLQKGYRVTVYDLFLYGDTLPSSMRLKKIRGDIRHRGKLLRAARDHDAFIHLACISNDPSFELDPALGRSINDDAFKNVLSAVRENGIKRFILASSTSQYGVQPPNRDVTEDIPAEPITDYAKYKLRCEERARKTDLGDASVVFVRPATICGWAPRMRFDLSVNILTINALVRKKITIFGGSQMRPVLPMEDMVRFYELMLTAPDAKIEREAFNVGLLNATMAELAEMVRAAIDDPTITFETLQNADPRSYHINTEKMTKVLGFRCRSTVADAVRSIVEASRAGKIHDGLTNPMYYNVKRMQELNLK